MPESKLGRILLQLSQLQARQQLLQDIHQAALLLSLFSGVPLVYHCGRSTQYGCHQPSHEHMLNQPGLQLLSIISVSVAAGPPQKASSPD